MGSAFCIGYVVVIFEVPLMSYFTADDFVLTDGNGNPIEPAPVTPATDAEVDVLALDLALDLDDYFAQADAIMAKPIYQY